MSGEQRRIAVATLRGMRVTVRSVCPQDAGRMQDYLRRLTPASRYDRFLGPVNELSAMELDRITHGDDRHISLVAETKVDGARTIVGEARSAVAPDGLTAEVAVSVAVSVADGWRGRGLGALLLQHLECRARGLGARTLVGDVLRSNAPMKRLARKAGFDLTGVPADARLVRIVKDISAPPLGLPCAQLTASGLSIAA
jgi:GNAT superfamily N-acetyltransferase